MRIVHLDRPVGTIPFLPLCGDWGLPDSDGTKEPRGVTCPACLAAMAAPTPPTSSPSGASRSTRPTAASGPSA